jgi:drug/metabolite transporter (DMT)-like permease
MNRAAYSQLLLLGALWGAAFMFMRIAVPEFGAFALAGSRIAMAALAMLLLVLILREPLHFKTHWKKYLIVGAVNTAIPFIAYCFAALYIPAGYSAIANSTTPIWGALIAWLWFKEKLGISKWLGIAFAFLGVIALVGLQPVAITPMVIAGMLACLGAAAMYGTASFLIKRYLSDVPGISGATGMVCGALVWLTLPALFMAPAEMPSNKAWFAVAALAFGCTAFAYVLFFHLIKTIGPQRASSVAFLFPAFAAFWGWLFLNEPITLNMWIGMGLVFAGTALVSRDGTPTGAPTLYERVRDTLIVPFSLAASPMWLRKRLAHYVCNHQGIFRGELASARAGYLKAQLPQPADDVIAELRLIRVIDYADMWLSLLRSDRWVKRFVCVEDAERQRDKAALILIFHFGGGWWMSRYFRLLGERISIVMFRGAPGPSLAERYMHRWGILRLKWIEKICGSPLIVTDDGGAGKKIAETWQSGAHVYIASDMPPVLVRDSIAVPFFGREGYFPVKPLRLAAQNDVPVYAMISVWDRATLTPTIEFRLLLGDTPEEKLTFMVALHEEKIRSRPGAWHLWGEWPLFFDSPESHQ